MFGGKRCFARSGQAMDDFGFTSLSRKQQDPPVEHQLPVTYEELLTGVSKKMKITRNIVLPGSNSIHSEPKILEVNVKKGWKEGTKITFPKEGNQSLNKTPADIVFVIKDKPHNRFMRDKDNNLLHTAKISLRDALTGCRVPVKLLDDRVINIDMKSVTPSTKKVISGEGLPLPKNPNRRGDLIVSFDIQFPLALNHDQLEKLKIILPP